MSKSSQVVILSSLSHPSNVASCENDLERWVYKRRKKVKELRQYLCQNIHPDCVVLDLDKKDYNSNWHLNLIDPTSTVVIILSRGLIDFYNTPDRERITQEDRHTSMVEKIIKGLDSNNTCAKKYFFVMFDKEILSSVPVIWQSSICSVESAKCYSKVLSIIKNEIHDSFCEPLSHAPLMIYSNDEAVFINYWKKIYTEDKTYKQLSKYYIEQKLKPITDLENPDNVGSNCASEELITDQLYSGDGDEWKSKLIVIQGISGSGKSALAQMLCHKWGKGESLRIFRAVVVIGVNENNFKKPLIELMKFITCDTREKKERILNGLSGAPHVLFILDVENSPWRGSQEFYKTQLGDLLSHKRTENLLVLTNQLINRADKDSQIITDADAIYELQCFDQDQVKLFFGKRNCPIDMKCSEIFQELCKLPLYAVMIPRSDKMDKCTNLTAFCKNIVMQTLQQNLSTEERKYLDSLDNLVHKTRFGNVCVLAWDLVINQTNEVSIDNEKASKFRTQEDCLGFVDFVSKENKLGKATIFLNFRLTTIKYFLAAICFVFTVNIPDIGRDFLLPLMADHPIHNVWRFVTGLSKDTKRVNSLLESLGLNQAPPKLLYVQAISESELKVNEMNSDLKKIVSRWINSFNWEKSPLYPSDCLAIVKTFNYLDPEVKQKIISEVSELIFANCNLDNEGMFHLIECLSQLRSVRLINVGGNPNFLNPLSRSGCVGYMREILKNNYGTLKRLYMCYSGLNYAGLRILKATFLTFTDLVQLDLSRNGHLDSRGWSLFADILGELKDKKLRKLFLADNNIDSTETDKIVCKLTEYPHLELLNFNGNVINKGSMQKLVNVLEQISIKRLYLSNCRITDEVLRELLAFIRLNIESALSLITLVLSCNEFTDHVMEEMMKSLKVTTRLQTLTLNRNRIGNEASMQILSESLRQMPSLGALYLSQCRIKDDGALLLCKHSLNVSLDLRKNKIDDTKRFSSFAHTIV